MTLRWRLRLLAYQMLLRQSSFVLQFCPFVQPVQSGPPQSTSVSSKFLMPSLHVTPVHAHVASLEVQSAAPAHSSLMQSSEYQHS